MGTDLAEVPGSEELRFKGQSQALGREKGGRGVGSGDGEWGEQNLRANREGPEARLRK